MSALDTIDRPVSRRQAIVGLGAAAGVLTLGFPLRGAAADAFAPNAFIRINATGRATFILPYVEMGQGAYTSQVQILAEELDLDVDQVAFEPAPPDLSRYAHPAFGDQITGGSAGLRGAWATLRTAGAAAREMLVQAAAKRWDVAAGECETRGGAITHRPTGRSFGYGELTADAARLPVPANPQPKARAAYRVLGKPTRRVDTAAKTDGSALFGIDARPPGMRYAMVQACPVLGGTLKNVDGTIALKVSGVRQVVSIGNAVAVVADTTWAAKKGLAALEIA